MIEFTDFTCTRTLLICENVMLELCKDNLPKDMLSYLYNFTLNKSFPEAVTIDLHGNLDSACELYLTVLRIVCNVQKDGSDTHLAKQIRHEFFTPRRNRKFRK